MFKFEEGNCKFYSCHRFDCLLQCKHFLLFKTDTIQYDQLMSNNVYLFQKRKSHCIITVLLFESSFFMSLVLDHSLQNLSINLTFSLTHTCTHACQSHARMHTRVHIHTHLHTHTSANTHTWHKPLYHLLHSARTVSICRGSVHVFLRVTNVTSEHCSQNLAYT